MRRFIFFAMLALILSGAFVPACAVESGLNDFIRLTDCLEWAAYLKSHPFYGQNPENLKIFTELKARSESGLESFAKIVLADPAKLDRFIETATASSKASLVPLVAELKRRALAKPFKDAFERLGHLEVALDGK